MRLLLDENLSDVFKELVKPFLSVSVKDMGWEGTKNGELMKLISQERFDIFLTADKNLPFQQNLSRLTFGLWVLDCPTNKVADLIQFAPLVLSELELIQPAENKLGLKYISVLGLSTGKKIFSE